MSTQQDIYAAGSENRPLMLNKENYVPWSSRLLRYAKSRPNGKLIYNSIINGPYVRQMIPEPGDQNREVFVNETFHEQTDDELTEKELKQVEADDQAIQTILLGLPEDIYAAVDSCETAQEIWLRVQQMMKGSDIGIQEKKAKLFNEWERFTSTNGESIESYYHRFSKLMNDFKRNKQFPEKIASNLKSRQTDADGWRQWWELNPNGNGNVIAVQPKGNVNGNNGDLEEIEEVNANCILMANLQQASTSEEQYTDLLEPIPEPHQVQQNNNNVIFVVSSVEQNEETIEQNPATVKETPDESLAKHRALEFEIERLLRVVFCQDIMSIVQSNSVVDTSNLQSELEPQLGDLNGKSKDTLCASDILDPLSQKLENENVELEFQASKQKDPTKGSSVNTQFCKQSILGKPPSSSRLKLYSVTHFPKSKGLPKIDESHALLKPVTSNSIPSPQTSKVVKNEKVIAPGIFRIDSRKTSREDKFVHINKVRASIRTNPIIVSQPHVITKKYVNSDSDGLSSTGVDYTAKTRRP
ncbi:hypothetical protein Tco_0620641 [Tanacetum coccineum]